MKQKSVKKILPAHQVNMDGNLLFEALPATGTEFIDPFLLIHHWNDELPGGYRQQEIGVGPHPHRGFSPVTLIYEGEIQHRDSFGNNCVVKKGGVQWMFAGRGITHSERPSKKMAEEGGKLEIIQLWVNAPASSKMDLAYYKAINAKEIPCYKGKHVKLDVICGKFQDLIGPAQHLSPIQLYTITIQKNSKFRIPSPSNHNTIIYLLDGKIKANDKIAIGRDMIWLNQNGDFIELEAIESTRFVYLEAEPLNEPVAKYGPFVMTNETEIMEAIRDAQMGKMGILIEEF